MSILSLVRSRLFIAALVLGVALLVVAACNGDDDDGDGDRETPAADETPAGTETPALPTPIPPRQAPPTPEPPPPEPPPTPASETPAPGEETAEIMMIPSNQFDRSELTISSDTDVTITADDTDGGVPHNFSVYTDDSATDNLGMTEICNAPCVDTVTLNLAAGDYFFRCEVHPSIMTGALIVQ